VATFAHLSTAARYWEVALVKVVGNLGYDGGVVVYDCQWAEDTSDEHALQSDSHRDVATTTTPSGGQVLTFNSSTGKWEPGAGAGRTFAYFVGG
jgi:hypothetical protein